LVQFQNKQVKRAQLAKPLTN